MSLYCYRYDGTFGGFLTCVFESYVNKELPTSFAILSDGPTLLEEREVTTHDAHAGRVYTALAKKVSPEFQKLIERAFLTCLSEKELALYTLIRRGLIEGDRVRRDLTDPTMARVNLALAKMWTEWDHLKGFVRFSELDGALVGEIEPKNRVLPLLAPPFCRPLLRGDHDPLRPHPQRGLFPPKPPLDHPSRGGVFSGPRHGGGAGLAGAVAAVFQDPDH